MPIYISPEDEEIILCAKKSLLFNEGTPWIKKGRSGFGVAKGSYDGAETCEIVGLFMLSELKEIRKANPGLYRDDLLVETPGTPAPQQAKKMKKQITAIFDKQIIGKANIKSVEFLDVTFDLETETFKLFN